MFEIKKTSDISKKWIEKLSKEIAENVNDGNESAIELLKQCNAINKIIDNIRESVMPIALDEYHKHKEGLLLISGNYEIEQMETAVKYDFSNDAIWQRLNDEIEIAMQTHVNHLIEAKKEREKVLKATKSNPFSGVTDMKTDDKIMDIDTETGEFFERKPPIKTSKTTLKFTLKA